MEEIKLKEDFIKLGQLMKAAGMAQTGVEAKIAIKNGLVKVNGIIEHQRGKKLYPEMIIEYNKQQIKVVK